jgi:predicted ferric reductase
MMAQTLWSVSRATGLVAVPLLTLSVTLGLVGATRFATARWPRFALTSLHRNVAMLSVLFVLTHVVTATVNPFSRLGWLDTVLPFVSGYNTVWRGLGAVALDLLLAVAVAGVIRTRVGPRAWRVIHAAGYVCLPVGLVHGLGGGGADTRLDWVVALNVLCVATVVAALLWRLRSDIHPDERARRLAVAVGR